MTRRPALAVVGALLAFAATACAAGPSALHMAAATGDVEVVRTWVAQKRNLDVTYDEPMRALEGNYSRTSGLTALMTAARMGHAEIVRLLVDGGANLYAESRWPDGSHRRSAFDYAVEGGRVDIAEYLWTRSDRKRFAVRLDDQIAAVCARTCGQAPDARLALFLIAIAADDARGRGIGRAACWSSQPRAVLAFLDREGVRFPKNTLHCIAYESTGRAAHSPEERIAVATFLLDHGADPNDRSSPTGFTPLMGAAGGHDLDMVRLLLGRGADPNVGNAEGRTPLAAAADTCYGGPADVTEPKQKVELAVIEALLQAGADPARSAGAARPGLSLLTSCCQRTPQTATQRRICEIFRQ